MEKPARLCASTETSISIEYATSTGQLVDCERLDEWVAKLDGSTVRRLLKEAAILHSDMYTSVWTEKRLVELAEQCAKSRVMREEQIKVLDFPKQIQGVDRTINHRFTGLRASKQYNLAGEAEGSVQYDIKKICEQIRSESTQDNKVKAILALFRIGSIVAKGVGVIGKEVRKGIGQEPGFMDDLWKIVGYMDDSDKLCLGQREDLMTTLERFESDSQSACIFEGSEKIVSCFKRAAGEFVGSEDVYDEDHYSLDEYGNRRERPDWRMATPREPDDTEIAPVEADENNTPRDLSSRMPQRSAFPEIHDQAQNAPAIPEGASGHQPGHPGYRTSSAYQQHHYHADTSDHSHHLTNAQPSGLWSHNSRQPADTQPSGLASLPEPSKDVPIMPQVPASYALQAPPNHLSAYVQPTPNQPLHVGFPPYAMFGHQSTNHVYPNPPANISLARLPNVISWVDERTVRDYLAIAVVRHKDIHDMVEREYGRIVKEHQDR
ncbi:hypothetical protein KCU67_g7754, partial [Aureobasidium melanogenum]